MQLLLLKNTLPWESVATPAGGAIAIEVAAAGAGGAAPPARVDMTYCWPKPSDTQRNSRHNLNPPSPSVCFRFLGELTKRIGPTLTNPTRSHVWKLCIQMRITPGLRLESHSTENRPQGPWWILRTPFAVFGRKFASPYTRLRRPADSSC